MTFWEVFGIVFTIGSGFFGYEYMVYHIGRRLADRIESLGFMVQTILGIVIPASLLIALILHHTGFVI